MKIRRGLSGEHETSAAHLVRRRRPPTVSRDRQAVRFPRRALLAVDKVGRLGAVRQPRHPRLVQQEAPGAADGAEQLPGKRLHSPQRRSGPDRCGQCLIIVVDYLIANDFVFFWLKKYM